ncbi:hypothetical protein MBRA_32290 [Mycobacterium branderi]|uniref:Transposase n=1 Tax=Mycobacterium branderi TaxID=43348 RepID=A0ABM7KQ13_9MYCO|nr:hypothetical protein MBRA_32290 [Mycobacterium branderi]
MKEDNGQHRDCAQALDVSAKILLGRAPGLHPLDGANGVIQAHGGIVAFPAAPKGWIRIEYVGGSALVTVSWPAVPVSCRRGSTRQFTGEANPSLDLKDEVAQPISNAGALSRGSRCGAFTGHHQLPGNRMYSKHPTTHESRGRYGDMV